MLFWILLCTAASVGHTLYKCTVCIKKTLTFAHHIGIRAAAHEGFYLELWSMKLPAMRRFPLIVGVVPSEPGLLKQVGDVCGPATVPSHGLSANYDIAREILGSKRFFVSKNQHAKQDMNGRIYDYIIVRGGSAGCVLANRLSADPKWHGVEGPRTVLKRLQL
jgi:hypothetical protein